ncbi:MAG TPA: hypothetical protein VIV11_03500 [Kofleriaceae bacterium]
MAHPLLPIVDEVLAKLTDATLRLSEAAKWADRDRAELTPLALLGGPIKYWKWHKAKQAVGEAVKLIDTLRTRSAEARDLPELAAEFSKLDMVNDMFDLLPFNVRRVGTKGGPSPIKQQLGVETTVLNQIETTRTTVEHALSEVGLLHARLRASAAG